MERKYKSQGRQLLEDLSGITIGSKAIDLVKELAKKTGRKRTDPEAVETTKFRNKSMYKGISKVKPTQMDKERTDRIKLRKLKRGGKKDSAYKQTAPAAEQSAIDRKYSPLGKYSPRAFVRDAASGVIDMFRDSKGKENAKQARKDMKKKVSKMPKPSGQTNKMGGGKVKGYKKGGAITYRMTGGQVVDNSYD